jgi:hypothetical protein
LPFAADRLSSLLPPYNTLCYIAICAGKIDEYGAAISNPADYDPDDAFSTKGLMKMRAALEGDGNRLALIFKYFQLTESALESVFNEVLFILKSRQGEEEQVDPWFQRMLNRHSHKVVWLMETEGFMVEKEVEEEVEEGDHSEVEVEEEDKVDVDPPV